MVNKIKIFGKRQFDDYMNHCYINDDNVETDYANYFFISIVGTSGDSHWFKSNHANVMNLEFDDITIDMPKKNGSDEMFRAFSDGQASKLYEFIKRNSGHTDVLKSEVEKTDLLIRTEDPDFDRTGLKTTSILRLHRLITVSSNIILRELGVLSKTQQEPVNQKLRVQFKL